MIKIRKGVFETNSSSMHTLVLTNNNTWVSKEEIEEFKNSAEAAKKDWIVWNDDHTGYYLTIEADSFGREFRLLTLWHAKLQYMAAVLGVGECVLLSTVLKEYLGDDFLGILITAGTHSYMDDDALCPCVDYYGLSGCFGDIDHQSYGIVDNALSLIDKDRKEAVRKILFDNTYVIVVDGDETCAFDELITSGLMEDTYFTHIFRETHPRDENGNIDWDNPVISFQPMKDYLKNFSDED